MFMLHVVERKNEHKAYHSAPLPPSMYTFVDMTPSPTKLEAARMMGRREG